MTPMEGGRSAQAILFVATSLLVRVTGAAAADFVTGGVPPETPEVTAAEIQKCVIAAGGATNSKAEFLEIVDRCSAQAAGLTGLEFSALATGCAYVNDEAGKASCIAAVEELRPQFVPSGIPSAAGITAAELAGLELGCAAMVTPMENRRCSAAVAKIRSLLLHPGAGRRPSAR